VISLRPETFAAQMKWLAESRVPVASLDAVRRTPGSVAITFDDGFGNFYEHAWPVLGRYGFPATVFVVSGYCGRRNNWPTQPRGAGIPELDLMSWSQVEEVSRGGVTIGSHTVTHPRLGALGPAEVDQELGDSRTSLEDRTGRPVTSFAYPYGECTPAVRSAVLRHYAIACGTELDWVRGDADPAALPRIEMYYFQNHFWFEGLQSMRGTLYLAARGALRKARARLA
jgi:peptidoglycan/xylan/chitin deacetylase (PgdA/CDA1 family)